MFYILPSIPYYVKHCIYNSATYSICGILFDILIEIYILGYIYGIVPYALFMAFHNIFISHAPSYYNDYRDTEIWLYRFTKGGCVFIYVITIGIIWPVIISYVIISNTIHYILSLVY